MNKPEQESFRKPLLELGKRLKGDVSDLASEAFRSMGGEASGGLSNAPLHMADLGSDHYAEEITINLLENQEKQLEEIAAALQRIDGGTFGVCENCQKEIARARLQVIPYARYCVDCARQAQASAP